MSNEDDYLKQLIKRAEELMVTQETKGYKDESLKKIPAPNAPPEKTKQKRFYSEEQKQKLRERLELARAKSKEVRELKKNIGQIKSSEKKEEKEEKRAAKFNEQSLEEKIEKIKQHRQYNAPKEEIQGPKVEKPQPQPEPKPEPTPAPAPAPTPTLLTSSITPAPQPARPKYFMPTMKYVTKHKFNNPL